MLNQARPNWYQYSFFSRVINVLHDLQRELVEANSFHLIFKPKLTPYLKVSIVCLIKFLKRVVFKFSLLPIHVFTWLFICLFIYLLIDWLIDRLIDWFYIGLTSKLAFQDPFFLWHLELSMYVCNDARLKASFLSIQRKRVVCLDVLQSFPKIPSNFLTLIQMPGWRDPLWVSCL